MCTTSEPTHVTDDTLLTVRSRAVPPSTAAPLGGDAGRVGVRCPAGGGLCASSSVPLAERVLVDGASASAFFVRVSVAHEKKTPKIERR